MNDDLVRNDVTGSEAALAAAGFVRRESMRAPPKHGICIAAEAGDLVRVVLDEGPQVVDLAVVARDDPARTLHLGQSLVHALLQGAGGPNGVRQLMTSPPDEQVLLEVVCDTVGRHVAWLGSRCSRSTNLLKAEQGLLPREVAVSERSCQQNVDEALAALGAPVPYRGDIYNLFMQVDVRAAFVESRLRFQEPAAIRGDMVVLRAARPVFVAMSACPNEDSALNAGRAKGFIGDVWSRSEAAERRAALTAWPP